MYAHIEQDTSVSELDMCAHMVLDTSQSDLDMCAHIELDVHTSYLAGKWLKQSPNSQSR